jgi:hypothetical protein
MPIAPRHCSPGTWTSLLDVHTPAGGGWAGSIKSSGQKTRRSCPALSRTRSTSSSRSRIVAAHAPSLGPETGIAFIVPTPWLTRSLWRRRRRPDPAPRRRTRTTAIAQTRAPGPRPAACLRRTRNRRQIRPAALFPNERKAEATEGRAEQLRDRSCGGRGQTPFSCCGVPSDAAPPSPGLRGRSLSHKPIDQRTVPSVP